MELFHNIYLGFSVAMLPSNLFFCFLGVFFGTLVGVLPGLGSPAAIALLLPATFYIPPAGALIMLAGIYYGAQYGGSTTSILVNIPGEATSVITCLDGYQMARQGRAGTALGISAFGSFIGGTLSVVGLMLLGPFLARFAIRFGPTEYFALMFLATVALTFLTEGSKVKGCISALAGFFIGTIGIDYIAGVPRFNFGTTTLMKGVGLVPVAMGLFGIAEVLTNLEQKLSGQDIFKGEIKGLLPTKSDWKESIGPITRGSLIGFLLGILPGGGAVMSSFTSYAIEKRVSSHPEAFGTGVIAGVAGPETANNAATGGALIPLLTLGIPTNSVMALLMGAMVIHGIKPSPLLISENPQIFWGVIASMYMGNIMLLILNLPLIALWVKILKIPPKVLFPLILLFCLIGVYSAENDSYDLLIMLVFGAIGYLMRKARFEPALLMFAMIISPIMETNFRKSLLISRGSFITFFSHPISAVLIGLSFIIIIISFFPKVREKATGPNIDGSVL
jgi:putative tricarboxylic transport membrane protein